MNKTNPKSLASYTNTKVDWTKVPAGTMIHVRDYDCEDWNVREFRGYDNNGYCCKNVANAPHSHIYWEQAELTEEQSREQVQNPSVATIMQMVDDYIGSSYPESNDIKSDLLDVLNNLVEQANITRVKLQVQFEGDDVLVPYRTVTKFFNITKEEYELIKTLYPANKVNILKFMRNKYNQGLKETKDICDTICGLNT